jgi:hypothetical protein
MPLHLTAPPNQKFPLAAGGAPAIASRTTNGADLLASNKIDSNSGHSGMTRRPDLSAEARPPGLPSRGPQRVRRNPAPNGKLAPSLQPPRPDHIDPRNFDDYYLRGPDVSYHDCLLDQYNHHRALECYVYYMSSMSNT